MNSRKPLLSDLPSEAMNPRYAMFLATTPEDVSFYGFRTWILSKWFAWEKISGHGPDMAHRPEHHAAFDAWLAT